MKHPEIFRPENARILRRYIYEQAPEINGVQKYVRANVAVINASDNCPLLCPNCMYAAPNASRIYNGNVPFLKADEASKLAKILNQAEVKLIVFSGGGESLDNMHAVEKILQECSSIEECVIITSGYFAATPEETANVIDRIAGAVQQVAIARGEIVKCIFRLSYDRSHDVPTANIENIIRHIIRNKYKGIENHVIIRTLLSEKEHRDEELASTFGATLKPEKNCNNAFDGVPVIDSFPTRWLCADDFEIPVIYKPVYYEGFAEKNHKYIQSGSWREIKQAEEDAGTPFNLSIRGPRGEGHNYYETIIKGYSHWVKELGGIDYYVTPKDPDKKELCLYIPADGRVSINASSPDSNIHISEVGTWQNFLRAQYRDVLQTALITRPTDEIVTIAEEVEPELQRRFDQRNFVFAVPRLTLETAPLRLYLTLRLLQDNKYRQIYAPDNPVLTEIINEPASVLGEAYRNNMDDREARCTEKKLMPVDPIIGHEPSIISVGTKSGSGKFESIERLLNAIRLRAY